MVLFGPLSRSCRGRVPTFQPLGGLSLTQSVVELEEIVGSADQGPLALHLSNASEQERPKTSRLLDLAKGWLHDCLPPPVGCVAFPGGELSRHPFSGREVDSWP